MTRQVFIGCAGWSVASGRPEFGEGASVLERYATRFTAVEINSSFYRPHRPATYAKWAASVPDGFRFSVKVPKAITHTAKLRDVQTPLEQFVEQVSHLGEKLGPLLVQLPPSLCFDAALAGESFAHLRSLTPAPIVCEPRHATWFAPEADALLNTHQVAQVAADPAIVPQAARPGGWPGVTYYRWHGSPRRYYSAYTEEALQGLGEQIQALNGHVWVIFDNTAGGEAVGNGLSLLDELRP
ncbi:DUF72 domain-containing protein [Deinococcus cavernae]|uniref:DUF72 domain-containing protein n=1 Tax=Deinococcus cavernae TaxID=2320857 RepID=A0A418VB16_9DEIO|nr:DUF72 domain-containing protein [Deinococcus cavernae]RJF73324.1 DUF72 domain-containing protein [Deinococcus cavernae]